jgi:hypothetical protein
MEDTDPKQVIPGYSYGSPEVPASPVTMAELGNLEAAAGWSEADAIWMRVAAEILVPQAEAMVDHWRAASRTNITRPG